MNVSDNFEVLELNQEDQKWVETSLQIAKEMVDFYLKVKPENYLDPLLLDQLFIACLEDLEQKKITPNVIVAALGCALGQCLINELGFRWIIYKDELGADVALKHDQSNWFAYPISSVLKRIDTGETNFISAIVESYKKGIEKE